MPPGSARTRRPGASPRCSTTSTTRSTPRSTSIRRTGRRAARPGARRAHRERRRSAAADRRRARPAGGVIAAALVALTLAAPHVAWTARLSAPVGTPTVADGHVYVATGAKHTRLHALD